MRPGEHVNALIREERRRAFALDDAQTVDRIVAAARAEGLQIANRIHLNHQVRAQSVEIELRADDQASEKLQDISAAVNDAARAAPPPRTRFQAIMRWARSKGIIR